MNRIRIKKLLKSKNTGNSMILLSLIILLYLLISLYFAKHFFFNTVINGVDVSLQAHNEAENSVKSYVKEYKLKIIERNGKVEGITGEDIGMQYNEKSSFSKIYQSKNSLRWIGALVTAPQYYVSDLFVYNKDKLDNKIRELKCLNQAEIEPKNVSFQYANGSYELVREIYGNKIYKDKLKGAIEMSIVEGERELDLDKKSCYEDPKYTVSSEKTPKTKNLLNKYVSTKITYTFGDTKEVLDGSVIKGWLSVDENLDVKLSEFAVMKYVKGLGRKYDTVGTTRNFKTSTGKIVEVKGGLYGWKLDFNGEVKAILRHIKLGDVLEKEPAYTQKAGKRGENEIGKTYVEVNITKQHLWFYKDGRLVVQGDVVTGNPNRGRATVLGTYMVNYKQKGATLTGPDYEAEVTYWMPFFGNIGIHDASWRYSFGGEIYKRNGTHGCVNAPLYLAKTIFENIGEGTPVICYEE